jgi:hypothetical protein
MKKDDILAEIITLCPASIDTSPGSNIAYLCSLMAEQMAIISRALETMPDGDVKNEAIIAFKELTTVPARVLQKVTG